LAAQRTADLIEQVMRCALTECGELIDPGSAISLEVPEVPSARSTALAEAVRTAVGEAVNAITGGASANGGGSSPTPPAASAQPTRDRDHDDKPHEHDHPFGNPGGHHHHDHTHSPDPTPPTAPGWYEFDRHKGWRLLFSLTPTAAGPHAARPGGRMGVRGSGRRLACADQRAAHRTGRRGAPGGGRAARPGCGAHVGGAADRAGRRHGADHLERQPEGRATDG
jgi:hypothetical protein